MPLVKTLLKWPSCVNSWPFMKKLKEKRVNFHSLINVHRVAYPAEYTLMWSFQHMM